MLGIAILMGVVGLITAQRYDWRCSNYSDTNRTYTKVDSVFLCFHLLPYNIKIGFPILVDDYSMIEVPKSYEYFGAKKAKPTEVSAQLDTNPMYAPANPYIMTDVSRVQNTMHLIISVNKGVLTGFRWQTGCWGCNQTVNCTNAKTTYWDYILNKSQTSEYPICAQTPCSTVDATAASRCNLKVAYCDSDLRRMGRDGFQ